MSGFDRSSGRLQEWGLLEISEVPTGWGTIISIWYTPKNRRSVWKQGQNNINSTFYNFQNQLCA